MGKILVFQHVPYEILGTFDPMMGSRFSRTLCQLWPRRRSVPNVTKYDGLIVLGGPMNVGQADEYPHLKTELEALRIALDKEIPIMGICLGAQLLARPWARVSHVAPRKKSAGTMSRQPRKALRIQSLVTSKGHVRSLNGTGTHSTTA